MAGWLFGGLLGGGEQDCSTADARSDRTMAEIQQHWPLRPSLDPVMVVVQEVGRHLGRDTDPQGGRQWQFAVLRNLEPIAYSIGGGRFIVSDGLVAMVRDESQLAAVLAHEIAHQQLNHFPPPHHTRGRPPPPGGRQPQFPPRGRDRARHPSGRNPDRVRFRPACDGIRTALPDAEHGRQCAGSCSASGCAARSRHSPALQQAT